jgi:Protein of unknown function (DUF3466)
VQGRLISFFFRTISVCAVVASALGGQNEQASAQPFLTIYPGPGFDGTTGYFNPSFHQDDGTARPEASWALLNNAGTVAWESDFVPTTVNSYALRSNPFFGAGRLNDLAGPPVTPTSTPLAVNAFSSVVGQSLDANGRGRPVRWDLGSASPNVLAPLEHHAILGPPEGQANDLNDNGVAVGGSGKTHSVLLADLGDRAVRWDAAGNATELGNISSYTAGSGSESYAVATSEAYAINNVGMAVGYGTIYDATGASKGNRAVRWNAAGVATELGHLGTGISALTNSAAWAINEAGVAVGFATKFDAAGLNDGQRAVRWNAGSTLAIELQVLGTDADGSTFSKAYTVNEIGTAVGWLDKYDAQGTGQGTRAVVWNPAGQVTELGLVAGTSSKAFDINNLGVAVGLTQAGESSAAVYWNANGTPVDLNTLIAPASGWRLEQALAISDTGWVAGIGKFDDGPGGAASPYDRVFMLQVPVEVVLAGDYNASGRVDAADYVIWRKTMATLATLPNDTTPGWVQPVDYSVWRANFGRTAGAGAAIGGTSVPEPAAFAYALICGAVIMLGRRARGRASS